MKRLTFATLAGLMFIVFLGAMPEMSFARADTWKKKKDAPTKRAFLAAGAIDGKIYVIGGYKSAVWDPAPMATVEVYDPAADKWTKGSDMPTPRGALEPI